MKELADNHLPVHIDTISMELPIVYFHLGLHCLAKYLSRGL